MPAQAILLEGNGRRFFRVREKIREVVAVRGQRQGALSSPAVLEIDAQQLAEHSVAKRVTQGRKVSSEIDLPLPGKGVLVGFDEVFQGTGGRVKNVAKHLLARHQGRYAVDCGWTEDAARRCVWTGRFSGRSRPPRAPGCAVRASVSERESWRPGRRPE